MHTQFPAASAGPEKYLKYKFNFMPTLFLGCAVLLLAQPHLFFSFLLSSIFSAFRSKCNFYLVVFIVFAAVGDAMAKLQSEFQSESVAERVAE